MQPVGVIFKLLTQPQISLIEVDYGATLRAVTLAGEKQQQTPTRTSVQESSTHSSVFALY